jgi:hypothetical protein
MAKCLKVKGAKRCVKVDADVHAKASERSWHMHQQYPATTLGSGPAAKKLYLHRFVAGPRGTIIDHKNGDHLDNRRANLRAATKSQNTANTGPLSTNKSGLKGVVKHGKRFRAFAHKAGRTLYLGTFDSKTEAACAYNDKARKLFGEFARLNKVACPLPKKKR